MATNLAEALADFKKDVVLEEINDRLERGEDAVTLIGELQAGMNAVGEKFSQGDYYLAELMMSASLFTEAMAISLDEVPEPLDEQDLLPVETAVKMVEEGAGPA